MENVFIGTGELDSSNNEIQKPRDSLSLGISRVQASVDWATGTFSKQKDG